jgi:hypothetical protein
MCATSSGSHQSFSEAVLSGCTVNLSPLSEPCCTFLALVFNLIYSIRLQAHAAGLSHGQSPVVPLCCERHRHSHK